MINKKQKNKYLAFSLIEVLISLFLFTTALVGVVGLMAGEIWKSMDKRNETIAGQLSQEGIELVRNIRDNNWLADRDGFSGIDIGDNYKIDHTNITLNSGGTSILYIDNSSGLYSHVASLEAGFKRKIIITGTEQRKVTSVVAWGTGSLPADESGLGGCVFSNKCFYTQIILGRYWGAVK